MNTDFSPHELQILEHIETNPDMTQATLAENLGVAVGTVNFVVKRLIQKGYVRVKQLQRRRLKYIITLSGIAQRTRLAVVSVEYSMRLYRETRAEAKRLLDRVRRGGHHQVAIRGNGELADVVRLTCLEQGVEVATQGDVPVIEIEGNQIKLNG
jgi:DNA-binding MarR family transcriptional regulator